jgi:photosystem II stability/assembly factor-like uncharacterized protein
MSPDDPRTLYAGIGRIFGSSENGIYRTTDAGATWTKLTAGLPANDIGRISVGVAPSDADRLYAILTEGDDGDGRSSPMRGSYRSDDGGLTWTRLGVDNFQATYGYYLSFVSVDPTDPDTVFLAGLNLVRSTNAGASWATVTPPHVDLHAHAWDASGRFIVGDDGGVHRSTTLGNDWTSLNVGLATIQFYAGLSTHPTDDRVVFGGTQDNGTNRRDDDSIVWDHIRGGDGGWTQVDQTSPNVVFAQYQGTRNLARSTNGGDGFNSSNDGIDGGDRNCFLPPYLIDPTDPSRMIYATHRLYESSNGGRNWNVISGDLTLGAGAVRALAMGTDDPDIIYVATNDGLVQVSFDGGHTFEVIRTDNPGWPRVTRELFVDPSDAHTLYLAVAAFETDQVLRTPDAGQTWEVLDADLPDVPVNVLAADSRGASPMIFAGTDAGLYRSIDDGATWRRYSPDTPNAAVIDIRLQRDRCRLILGTQGRGAWRVALPSLADYNIDEVVNSQDFTAFLNDFVAGERSADYDLDGAVNSQDFIVFLNAFVNGCP